MSDGVDARPTSAAGRQDPSHDGARDDDAVVISMHGEAARSRARHPSRAEVHEAEIFTFARSAAAGTTAADTTAVQAPRAAGDSMQLRMAALAGLLRRRLTGEYTVDDFGFDVELTDSVLLPALEVLYDRWFRVEVDGAANLAVDGGALLVANHAGGIWPVDAAMTAVAVHREQPDHRHLRPLGADLLFGLPAVGTLARRGGSAQACPEDADRLLRGGELVGVWPEGFAGIGKPFQERYRLRRFGRGGYARAAIRAGVPLIPVSIVGAEEIHPVLGRSEPLARLLGLPYFPLTPTFPWLGPLGLIPLPTKWTIEFGEPIATDHFGPGAADDPTTVHELSDRVRDQIQITLDRMLARRESIWR